MQIHNSTGSLFGGLADLLIVYCQANHLEIPKKLEKIVNLERFDYQTWRDILSVLEKQSQKPALGLEIAQYVQTHHLGILGYLALSSRNLAEAMQRYYDFHRLIYDGNPLIITSVNDSLQLHWDFPKLLTTQTTDEIAIALMYQFLKQFLHIDDIELELVCFHHPAPKSVYLYEQYFKSKVRFNQEKTFIQISANMLSKPILQADPTLQNLLIQQAQALLSQLPHSTQLDERIQHAILVHLQQNTCSIENIAKQLNLSIRQLQRHLQQQNSSYQQRVQQVRLMLAKQYLQDPHLSLPEIALLLGYSEQSAFQRAFKQWTMQTPQTWRKKQHNELE